MSFLSASFFPLILWPPPGVCLPRVSWLLTTPLLRDFSLVGRWQRAPLSCLVCSSIVSAACNFCHLSPKQLIVMRMKQWHSSHSHSLTHSLMLVCKVTFLLLCTQQSTCRRLNWTALKIKWYQQLSWQAIIDPFVTPSSHLWLVTESCYLIFLLLPLLFFCGSFTPCCQPLSMQQLSLSLPHTKTNGVSWSKRK